MANFGEHFHFLFIVMAIIRVSVVIGAQIYFEKDEYDQSFNSNKYFKQISGSQKLLEESRKLNKNKVPAPTGCRNNLNFCGEENGQAYPIQEIERLLNISLNEPRTNGLFRKFFKTRFSNSARRSKQFSATKDNSKINSIKDDYDVTACESRHEIVPRYSQAKNVLGKWKYLVQTDTGIYNSLHVVICKNSGTICANNDDVPGGSEGATACRQLYKTHKFMAIDEAGEFVVDTFRLPSACVCMYKEGLSFRFSAHFPLLIQNKSQAITRPHDSVNCGPKTATYPFRLESKNISSQTIQDTDSSSAVLFPDDVEINSALNLSTQIVRQPRQSTNFMERPTNIDVSGCFNGKMICDETENENFSDLYPEEEIEKILHNQNMSDIDQFKQVFGTPCHVDEEDVKDEVQPSNVTGRFGKYRLSEFRICNAVQRYMYPLKARTSEGEWKYVVNTATYRQGILIEECLDKGVSCHYGGMEGNAPEGTACKQLYSMHNLLMYNAASQSVSASIETFSVQFPSACACHVDPMFFN